MKTLIIATLLLIFTMSSLLQASPIHIIPQPAYLKEGKGHFLITSSTRIVTDGIDAAKNAFFLNGYLKKYYGFELKIISKQAGIKNSILLHSDKSGIENNGAYSLHIEKDRVDISGDGGAGVFYGIQSLIQLLPFEKTTILAIPQLQIKDTARFAYRGMHLDVSRHFFDVDFIKQYIDLIAMYKFNTFHWHLTDDQGWRIEIKKYPGLTATGSKRNGTIIGHYPGKGNDNSAYGGFYTQEQVKEIVAYAAGRYITVIPEIELPGHSSAAIAAYPGLSCFPKRTTAIPLNMVSIKSVQDVQHGNTIKLVQETWGVFDDVYCAGKDSTFFFLQDVLDEVMNLFPSKYIHIGGDECPKTNWKQCPLCQRRMKENNLKDEHALQSYFIQRIEKYVNSKGRQIIGWDEILEGGLAPNSTVMSWRGEQGGILAARQMHQVIMAPGGYCYFNRSISKNEDSLTAGGFLPVKKVYQYDPVSDSLNAAQSSYIIGAEGCLWTEYVASNSKAMYMVLPRLSALSEVLWTEKAKKNWNDFELRLLYESKRYEWLGLNFCKKFEVYE